MRHFLYILFALFFEIAYSVKLKVGLRAVQNKVDSSANEDPAGAQTQAAANGKDSADGETGGEGDSDETSKDGAEGKIFGYSYAFVGIVLVSAIAVGAMAFYFIKS